ncbi:IS110 family transposase [Nocardia sp. NPDC004068]|uniref:IS110 family transposase n=1 Tax=Nocardia sp. NPDC004068 TaxID=3364303 RepID=UPI0036CA8674
MGAFCGIDWAESHHDVAVIDNDGKILGRKRISDDTAGFTELLNLLADTGDSGEHPIPVAIETDRGLLVAALRATARPIYAINPLSASRYRSRHQVSGSKSDAADAVLLANILRTDAAAHRRLPADTELAQAIRVLARAQQDALWTRKQLGNQLRSLLKDFYPAALHAFADLPGGLARPDARAVLAAAPTPARTAKLTRPQLRRLLIKAGRQRNIDTEVERLREVLRAERLRQLPMVENAMGTQLAALLHMFDAACTAEHDLAEETKAHFDRHPDAEILTSFPGLGQLSGARVLSEIGDDRTRFTDARGLRAYAGSAPITRASGKKTLVLHRHIKNRRLAQRREWWCVVRGAVTSTRAYALRCRVVLARAEPGCVQNPCGSRGGRDGDNRAQWRNCFIRVRAGRSGR